MIERKELTAREVAGSHNNFYEFLAGRGGAVWKLAGDYQPLPWAVEVTGECNKPRTFDLDDLLKPSTTRSGSTTSGAWSGGR